jgi:hypothetical protein
VGDSARSRASRERPSAIASWYLTLGPLSRIQKPRVRGSRCRLSGCSRPIGNHWTAGIHEQTPDLSHLGESPARQRGLQGADRGDHRFRVLSSHPAHEWWLVNDATPATCSARRYRQANFVDQIARRFRSSLTPARQMMRRVAGVSYSRRVGLASEWDSHGHSRGSMSSAGASPASRPLPGIAEAIGAYCYLRWPSACRCGYRRRGQYPSHSHQRCRHHWRSRWRCQPEAVIHRPVDQGPGGPDRLGRREEINGAGSCNGLAVAARVASGSAVLLVGQLAPGSSSSEKAISP